MNLTRHFHDNLLILGVMDTFWDSESTQTQFIKVIVPVNPQLWSSLFWNLKEAAYVCQCLSCFFHWSLFVKPFAIIAECKKIRHLNLGAAFSNRCLHKPAPDRNPVCFNTMDVSQHSRHQSCTVCHRNHGRTICGPFPLSEMTLPIAQLTLLQLLAISWRSLVQSCTQTCLPLTQECKCLMVNVDHLTVENIFQISGNVSSF